MDSLPQTPQTASGGWEDGFSEGGMDGMDEIRSLGPEEMTGTFLSPDPLEGLSVSLDAVFVVLDDREFLALHSLPSDFDTEGWAAALTPLSHLHSSSSSPEGRGSARPTRMQTSLASRRQLRGELERVHLGHVSAMRELQDDLSVMYYALVLLRSPYSVQRFSLHYVHLHGGSPPPENHVVFILELVARAYGEWFDELMRIEGGTEEAVSAEGEESSLADSQESGSNGSESFVTNPEPWGTYRPTPNPRHSAGSASTTSSYGTMLLQNFMRRRSGMEYPRVMPWVGPDPPHLRPRRQRQSASLGPSSPSSLPHPQLSPVPSTSGAIPEEASASVTGVEGSVTSGVSSSGVSPSTDGALQYPAGRGRSGSTTSNQRWLIEDPIETEIVEETLESYFATPRDPALRGMDQSRAERRHLHTYARSIVTGVASLAHSLTRRLQGSSRSPVETPAMLHMIQGAGLPLTPILPLTPVQPFAPAGPSPIPYIYPNPRGMYALDDPAELTNASFWHGRFIPAIRARLRRERQSNPSPGADAVLEDQAEQEAAQLSGLVAGVLRNARGSNDRRGDPGPSSSRGRGPTRRL